MIPFRGDPFDRFNHGQAVNRPMMFVSHQPQQIVQSPAQPSFFFTGPTPNFQQPYSSNLPLQQQPSLIFLPTQQQHPQQSWILQSPSQPLPPPSQTFAPPPTNNFHPIQPHFLPPQPSFSGGSGVPQNSFNRTGHAPLPSLGSGTGIPQPAFSGGTAVLKRKSHYLEESNFDPSPSFDYDSNRELPSSGSMPGQSFSNGQQQRFRSTQSRFTDSTGMHGQVPTPPRSYQNSSGEAFNSPSTHPPWANHNLHSHTGPSPLPLSAHDEEEQKQQRIMTNQLFQKHQSMPIDTLLKEPGRSQRPSQIIVLLRGLPGSGKSYVAELIKNEEELQSKGTNKPKILSIDNYFLTEEQRETKDPKTGKITKTSVTEYEYDAQMEETYRRSLIKLVRKSIDDRFYPFLIVDQNNEQLEHFRDTIDYAEANQFQVYFVELNQDPAACQQRNTHRRSLSDIEQIHQRWEQLPLRYKLLDIRSLLQSDAIDEVEMDDARPATTDQTEVEEDDSQITKKSKWEAMMETNPDRLDGVYQRRSSASHQSPSPIEKRVTQTSMNLDASPTDDSTGDLQSKRKKVRWADIEESAVHQHKKAVGFVVGQTEQDWQQMSDEYDPSQKLNRYKYI